MSNSMEEHLKEIAEKCTGRVYSKACHRELRWDDYYPLILSALREAVDLGKPKWIAVSEENKPDPDLEVIGYNSEWVTEYNPDGTRICFHNVHGWQGAIWSDRAFGWTGDYSAPTHYQIKPSPPQDNIIK